MKFSALGVSQALSRCRGRPGPAGVQADGVLGEARTPGAEEHLTPSLCLFLWAPSLQSVA